jgi:hypothetical protein
VRDRTSALYCNFSPSLTGLDRSAHLYPGTYSSARQRASEMYRAIFSASLAGLVSPQRASAPRKCAGLFRQGNEQY